jgi:hypothetical protein
LGLGRGPPRRRKSPPPPPPRRVRYRTPIRILHKFSAQSYRIHLESQLLAICRFSDLQIGNLRSRLISSSQLLVTAAQSSRTKQPPRARPPPPDAQAAVAGAMRLRPRFTSVGVNRVVHALDWGGDGGGLIAYGGANAVCLYDPQVRPRGAAARYGGHREGLPSLRPGTAERPGRPRAAARRARARARAAARRGRFDAGGPRGARQLRKVAAPRGCGGRPSRAGRVARRLRLAGRARGAGPLDRCGALCRLAVTRPRRPPPFAPQRPAGGTAAACSCRARPTAPSGFGLGAARSSSRSGPACTPLRCDAGLCSAQRVT